MKALEEKGLYDPYNHNYKDLDNDAGRLWRACWELRQWRKQARWEDDSKVSVCNRWYFLAGALLVLELCLAVVFRTKIILVLMLLTTLFCVYATRRSERAVTKKREADPLWRRSQQLIDAFKAYAMSIDYYNAYFKIHPDDTDGLDRICTFLARAQDAILRKTTTFNAAIKMMETKKYLESNTGERVALAEVTAASDRTVLESAYDLAHPDEVLLTDQELLEIEQELQEALHGNVPQLHTGTRT